MTGGTARLTGEEPMQGVWSVHKDAALAGTQQHLRQRLSKIFGGAQAKSWSMPARFIISRVSQMLWGEQTQQQNLKLQDTLGSLLKEGLIPYTHLFWQEDN